MMKYLLLLFFVLAACSRVATVTVSNPPLAVGEQLHFNLSYEGRSQAKSIPVQFSLFESERLLEEKTATIDFRHGRYSQDVRLNSNVSPGGNYRVVVTGEHVDINYTFKVS